MKSRALNLAIYMMSFAAAQHSGAEIIANSQSVPRPPAPVQRGLVPIDVKPVNLAPDVQPNSMNNTNEPRIGADRGNEGEVKGWLKNFDLVVVIDKAASKQTLTAYRNLGSRDDVILDVAMKTKVSTGVETRDCHYVRQMTPGPDGMRWVTSVRPIYKHTPTGYYVPKVIDADHYSSAYDAAHMKNAVGWYAEDGFYTHEHPAGTRAAIGHRASHGCVRMYADDAQDLFTMVMLTGGPIDPSRDANLRARCPQDPESKVPCTPSSAVNASLERYFNGVRNGHFPFSTDAKRPRDAKSHMPRLTPYDQKQDVLMVNKDGSVAMDPQTKTAKTQPAYRTLYIVKDSDIGTARETRVPPPVTCPSVDEANAGLAEKYNVRAPSPTGQAGATSSNNPFGDFFNGLGKIFNPGQQQRR